MEPAPDSNQSLRKTDEYPFFNPGASRTLVALVLPGGARGVQAVGGGWSTQKVPLRCWWCGVWEFRGGAKKTGTRVTYGGAEIIGPGRFVNTLEGLGKVKT